MSQRMWDWFLAQILKTPAQRQPQGLGGCIRPRWLQFPQTGEKPRARGGSGAACPCPRAPPDRPLPWAQGSPRPESRDCSQPRGQAEREAPRHGRERWGTNPDVFPGPPSLDLGGGERGLTRRRVLTRVRVEVEAGHVLPRRQRALQARSGQASGRGRTHAVAVHRQAGQQRRRGAVHGPRRPKVSAIHPPRECRGQPPTRPAGLVQRDLKVRPQRSPRVLG